MPRFILRVLRILALFIPRWSKPITLPGLGGLSYLLDLRTLRIVPPLAGADGDDEDDADDDADEDDDDSDDEDDDDSDDEDDDDDDDDDAWDKKRAKATILKQRQEERRLKKELADAKAKVAKHEKEKLTKEERLKREADEGKTAAQSATDKLRRANLVAELTKSDYGIVDARAAAKLAETIKVEVEYDDDDEPTNVEDVVEALTETYGFLKGEVPEDKKKRRKAPRTNGDDAGDDEDDVPKLTAEELQYAKQFGMTPKEYAAFKDKQPKLPAKKKTT